MDFSEALKAMKEEKKVRRKGKRPILLESGILYTQYNYILDYEKDKMYLMTVEDILAEDWEVINANPTLEDAILLAVNAHNGQKDKLGKEYILHPLWVMNHIEGNLPKIVAVLHDVVEDTNICLTDLSDVGYSTEIVEAIDAITQRPGEDRHAYLDRVMGNSLALQVKKVDILHNTSDERMKNLPDSERKRLSEKYENGDKYLEYRSNYKTKFLKSELNIKLPSLKIDTTLKPGDIYIRNDISPLKSEIYFAKINSEKETIGTSEDIMIIPVANILKEYCCGPWLSNIPKAFNSTFMTDYYRTHT